jgi:hypothetical protein
MSMDNKAELISVIQTTILRRGLGNKLDPIRIVTQYWTTDGRLLAEVDPTPPLLFNDLAAAGDRLAHELQHTEHGYILDKWWELRGGHDRCTVCNPPESPFLSNRNAEL